MMRLQRVTGFIVLTGIAALVLVSFREEKKVAVRKPNIIVILADDLGYSDLSAFGSTHVRTPNIDGIGADGAKCTNAYSAAPICSPSRAGLITGHSQVRFGYEFMPREGKSGVIKVDSTADDANVKTGLPSTQITLAQLLKGNGYTTGVIGKWHLGSEDGFYPDQHGFDYGYYFQSGLSPYVEGTMDTSKYVGVRAPWALTDKIAWTPRGAIPSTALREGREIVKDTGYLTFSLANKAVNFIDKNKEKPFFLYLTFNAPHDPYQVPKAYYNKIQNEPDSLKRVYYGMIEALDDAVGQVLTKLKTEGLDDNTMVVFTSDNGGATYARVTDNYPLRGGKCTHFEGGTSVPFFIKYPAAIAKGSDFTKPVISFDIFATAAAVSGSTLPKGVTYDGVNLIPYLKDRTAAVNPHPVLVWRSGYSKAYIKDGWKIVVNDYDKRTYLFHLATDRSEKTDLSKAEPARLKELQEALQKYEKANFGVPLWKSYQNTAIDERGEEYHFPI